MAVLRFILPRNYNGVVVDMDSLDQVNPHLSKELQWFRGRHGFFREINVHFTKELQWFRGGHGFFRSSGSSFE